MTPTDDLLAVLDQRARRGDAVRPDLGSVRARARRRRRSQHALTAGVAATAVGIGAGALFVQRDGRPAQVVTGDPPTTASIAVTTTTTTAAPVDDTGRVHRALPGTTSITLEVGAGLPVYGPYPDDHLWRPPASCPAVAWFTSERAADGSNRSFPSWFPAGTIDGTTGGRTYRAVSVQDSGDLPPGSVVTSVRPLSVALITDATPGDRYRLRSASGLTDEVTATGPGVILVLDHGEQALPLDHTIDPNADPAVVERLDADGNVLATLTADSWLPGVPVSTGLPIECRAPVDTTVLPDAGATDDAASAEAAITTVVTGLARPVDDRVGMGGMTIVVDDVHVTSATSAWVRYRITDGEAQALPQSGIRLWAEVTLTDGSWALTDEAACAYAHAYVQTTCDALPDTAPAFP